MMGSGGMIIMDEDTCMVDIARYFMDFTQDESCGKCTPCRVGTRVLLTTLERICAGEGKESDLERPGNAMFSDSHHQPMWSGTGRAKSCSSAPEILP